MAKKAFGKKLVKLVIKMKQKIKTDDKSVEEMDEEQRQAEILEENLEKVIEAEINKRAWMIGRKILDEMYLHGEDKIVVYIRRNNILDLDIIEIGAHQITGLLDNEVEYIKRGNLKEKSINSKNYQGIAQYRRSRF